MNATETTPPDRASIDTTDHIRAAREARSIAEEARTKRRRNRRILLIVCSVLAALGPATLALFIGVPANETLRILLLTVVPVAVAYVLLRPR
ncbi:ABC transporter permease [Rhodococcus hoagii]|nr:ABC transporter permease [Prescottella equi]